MSTPLNTPYTGIAYFTDVKKNVGEHDGKGIIAMTDKPFLAPSPDAAKEAFVTANAKAMLAARATGDDIQVVVTSI